MYFITSYRLHTRSLSSPTPLAVEAFTRTPILYNCTYYIVAKVMYELRRQPVPITMSTNTPRRVRLPRYIIIIIYYICERILLYALAETRVDIICPY